MKELNSLSIKNLNFEDIKESFKNFLRQQKTFTDYNLEGSNFAILFDILSYNTYYMAMYQNFISSESWIDSAVKRSSVVSHVKPIGFLPRTKKSSKFVISISIKSRDNDFSSSLTIPPYTKFRGGDFFFFNIEPVVLTRNLEGYFVSTDPVILFEGEKIVYKFISDDRNLYTIPYEDLDVSTLTVNVYNSIEFYEKVQSTGDYTKVRPFALSDTIIGKNSSSEIYFLQESVTGYYDLYFGDGVLGVKPDIDCIIETIFIKPSGSDANGIGAVFFISTDLGDTNIDGYTQIGIAPIAADLLSFGGLDRQSIDDIKKYAPYFYESQNRIVSLNDYHFFISQYLGEFDKLSIWGGEQNNPPRYGSVFCMIKPKGQEKLSIFEKEALKTYITSKSVMGLEVNICDPNLVYIIPNLKIRYSSRLAKNTQLFYNRVDSFLENFSKNTLNTFRASDLILYLKDNIPAIRSLTIRLKLMKKIIPLLNTVNTYSINFDTSIIPGTLTSSTNFTLDKTSTFSESFIDNSSGLVFYNKFDSVTGVTTKINVGTINYSTGLIIIKDIQILEMSFDKNYGTELVFWCNSLEDDFIGTKLSFPILDITSLIKDYINDPS